MRRRRLAIGDFWVASFLSIEFGFRWRVDLLNQSVNPDVVIPSSINPIFLINRIRPSPELFLLSIQHARLTANNPLPIQIA
jgi:hypothetical protein